MSVQALRGVEDEIWRIYHREHSQGPLRNELRPDTEGDNESSNETNNTVISRSVKPLTGSSFSTSFT